MSDWSWPQIIIGFLLALQAFGGIVLHGNEREPYNATSLILNSAVFALLLGWGGFWK